MLKSQGDALNLTEQIAALERGQTGYFQLLKNDVRVENWSNDGVAENLRWRAILNPNIAGWKIFYGPSRDAAVSSLLTELGRAARKAFQSAA